MKLGIYIRGLLALLLLGSTIGCLLADSGSESGTTVEIAPFDPDTYSCSPLNGDEIPIGAHLGVHGELVYLDASQPRYVNVADYFNFGHLVENLDLFFNQIYIPTRPFDRGFVTASGQTITTEQGNTLYEYFGLRLRGRLTRGNLPAGDYQLALLSDDGSILYMDYGNGMQVAVDNNGQHPTRFGCGMAPVELSDTPVPFELLYNQGPRFHIALTLMARPWPANPNDVQCGQQGNAMYFDSTQDPPAPMAAYNNLLARGWFPLEQDHYLLPEDKIENPCATPAPVISNFSVATIGSNSVTLRWNTDIEASSQVLYRLESQGTFLQTIEVQDDLTSHMVTVQGLTPNTNYVVKAVSKSHSGLSSESTELTVRTRR